MKKGPRLAGQTGQEQRNCHVKNNTPTGRPSSNGGATPPQVKRERPSNDDLGKEFNYFTGKFKLTKSVKKPSSGTTAEKNNSPSVRLPPVNGVIANGDRREFVERVNKEAMDGVASQSSQPGWEVMADSCGITDDKSATFSDEEADASAELDDGDTGRYISAEEESNLIDIDQVLVVTDKISLGTAVVLYRTALRRIVKSGDQAVCLSQFLFWYRPGKNHQRRLRVCREQKFWIAKTHKGLGEETGLTERQARAAVNALVKLGYVERRQFIFYGTKMCHLRLLGRALKQDLLESLDCEEDEYELDL
jgi:hypothetical protein